MASTGPTHRNAVVFCSDRRGLPLALFAAHKAARVSPGRDFDILICSLEPLDIPPALATLGIVNRVLPLAETLADANLPLRWLPPAAYLRLWLPGVLGDTHARLFYLDTDTYVATPDLARVFDIDIGPHAVAGVLDKRQWVAPNRALFDFRDFAIPCTRYLNTGVMLIDTAAFREQDVLSRCLAQIVPGHRYRYHDQSLLNLALRGDWAELHPMWNWQWTNFFPRLTHRVTPLIFHFSGPPRPWRAHEQPNNYDPALITEYRAFFDAHAPERAFAPATPGGLRYPWRRRALRSLEALNAGHRLRRVLAPFPDPWTARLPLQPGAVLR